MLISGKVVRINEITEHILNVVLNKTRNKKPYFVSLMFYYQLADVVKEHYLIDDFVKIWFRIRSNRRELPNNQEKFFTDVIGESIVLVRREGEEIEQLYNEYGMKSKDKYVFKDTGEIVEKHTIKNAIKNSQDTN
tara:strand:+ start:196 stop:600 length:405 start_codon:yes stop_codon:yes gene_type:complete